MRRNCDVGIPTMLQGLPYLEATPTLQRARLGKRNVYKGGDHRRTDQCSYRKNFLQKKKEKKNMDAFENGLYLAAQGMNAFKMQQCIVSKVL